MVTVLKTALASCRRAAAVATAPWLQPQCYPVRSRQRPCSSMAPEARLLWPLDFAAQMMVEGHKVGTRFPPSIMIISTSKPVTEDIMRQTLTHLWKKISVLRLGITERDDKYYYYEVDEIEVDYRELEDGADMMQELERQNDQGYHDLSAPLWKVCMSRAAPDAMRPMPELEDQYPYQYTILWNPHHAAYDGTTFAVIYGIFFDILDKVMLGELVDDSVKHGVFEPYTEIEKYDALIEEKFKKDPELLESAQKELMACKQSPILLRAFPPPGDKTPKTKFAYRRIDQALFDAMHKRCKQMGVTFNSALEASINTAIIKLVRAAGIEDEQFNISVTNATSMRRFMPRRTQPIMGLHVRSSSHVIPTSRDVHQHFWEYTKTIHDDLQKMMKSGAAMEQEVVRQMTMHVDPRTFYTPPPAVVREYGLTNMGDITPVIPGNGKAVQITSVILLAVIHHFTYMCLHQLHTFRGIPRYTLSYATNYMSDATANILMDTVLDVMRDISHTNANKL